MEIEKFKKIGKDKYKLYFKDGSNINLYEDIIIRNNLLLTKKIPDDEFEKLINENNNYNLYAVALNYISIRIRSKNEVINYLYKKKAGTKEIDKVVKRLENEGYINDFNFAKAYVNDQLLLSTSGPNKIKRNLNKLGVNDLIINDVMETIDNNIIKEKLTKLISKQVKIKSGSTPSLKLKLLNYFINLGYSKDMILSLLEKYDLKPNKELLKKEYGKLYKKYSNKYKDEKLLYFITQKLFSKGYDISDIKDVLKEMN